MRLFNWFKTSAWRSVIVLVGPSTIAWQALNTSTHLVTATMCNSVELRTIVCVENVFLWELKLWHGMPKYYFSEIVILAIGRLLRTSNIEYYSSKVIFVLCNITQKYYSYSNGLRARRCKIIIYYNRMIKRTNKNSSMVTKLIGWSS
jgi:hypothetical protein